MTPDSLVLAALSTFDGLGPKRLRRLLGAGAPADVWCELIEGRIDGAEVGIGAERMAAWSAAARTTDLDALEHRCRGLGVTVLTPAHPEWPGGLVADPDPPLVLFRRGAPEIDGPTVAVVGTRRCSSYGRRVAARLGRELAEAGAVVVSGLALGIDAESQRAALDAGGRVIGVVGSGLDVVYPTANRRLWADIGAAGQMWSEWGPGTPPARWRFPARNRLVAAMADALVVVESAVTGGSLHTVDAALERDVPVFAVPGPVDSASSEGTNRLLVQGCAPYTHLDDLRVVVDLDVSRAVVDSATSPALSGPAAAIVDRLSDGSATLAELVLVTGQSLVEGASLLDELQESGFVRSVGGWWERAK